MIPYIALIGFTVLFYSLLCMVQLRNVNKGKLYVAVITCAMVLLLGLRHPSMGVDLGYGLSYGYLASFQNIAEMSWKQLLSMGSYKNYEWGYILLNKLMGLFSQEEQYYLMVCAAISIIPIGVTIGRYSKNCRTSFLIFLGLTNFMALFSTIRQVIAAAIIFWGYRFIKERRLKSYLAVVLLASLFHLTALSALFAYPAYGMKMNRQARILLLGVVAVMFLLRGRIWNLLVLVTERSSEAVSNGSVELFLLFVAIYVYTVVFSSEMSDYDGMINLLFLCCCILALTEVSMLVNRIAYYYLPYMTLLLPEVLDDVRQKKGWREYSMHTSLVTGGFTAFCLYNLLNSSWSMAYPYYFCWQMAGN